MASQTNPAAGAELKKGDYRAAGPTDLRGPCPIVNSFANHGLIPRDGRNVRASDMKAAVRHIGLGPDLATLLIAAVYNVHTDDPNSTEGKPFGLRDPGQVDEDGEPILNLTQLSRPNALEHDCSLSQQDRELGDFVNPDPKLLAALVECGWDGENVTPADIGRQRKKRYDDQKLANSKLNWNAAIHGRACGEVAALHGVLGKGFSWYIPKEYLQALFGEWRLPFNEGWSPRWIPLTLPEFLSLKSVISSYAS